MTHGRTGYVYGCRCATCREAARTYSASRVTAFRTRGICVECGHRQAAPNRARCEGCLARQAERSAENRQSLTSTNPGGIT